MDYITCQAPWSTGFSRQDYWSGLPFYSRGDLPDPGMEPQSPTQQADSLSTEPPGEPIKIEKRKSKKLTLVAPSQHNL